MNQQLKASNPQKLSLNILFNLILILSLNNCTDEYSNYRAQSICGTSDDRSKSQIPQIARLSIEAGQSPCTGFLISESCLVTARHCLLHAQNHIEFNPPPSSPQGRLMRSNLIYQYDSEFIKTGRLNMHGEDWAVVKVKPSQITGKFPGQNGNFLPIYTNDLQLIRDESFKNIGYGVDEGALNGTQQTSKGKIWKFDPRRLIFRHNMDTKSGNSGSPIIRSSSNEVIGIHVNGGCNTSESIGNRAVMFYKNFDLLDAIQSCKSLEDN